MYDSLLELDSGQTVTNEAQTVPLNLEGNAMAWLHVKLGACAADADALNIRLQYKPDGTNWYTCPGGRVEQILGTHDNKKLKVPVFIPGNDTKGNLTPVRLDYELSENGTESFAITKVWLEPMLGATIPDFAVEQKQSEGLFVDLPKAAASIP